MPTGNLPPYFDVSGRIVARPPFVHRNVTAYGFRVKADGGKLQDLLTKMFSDSSGGKVQYKLFWPYVFVSIAVIQSVTSTHPTDKDKGAMPEIDASLWVLATRTRPLAIAFKWLPIYLFVDSGPAMAIGREVYGFPKQMGQFELFTSRQEFMVRAQVIPIFSPTSTVQWSPVIHIRPSTPATLDDTGEEWKSPDEFYDDMAKILFVPREIDTEFTTIEQVRQALLLGQLPMFFLKQFPDVEDATNASSQAIVEATASVTKFNKIAMLPGQYEINVSSHDSHPFEKHLGIARGWQPAGRGTRIEFDFVMEEGNNIWQAV